MGMLPHLNLLEIECVSLYCWQALEELMRLKMKAKQEITMATAVNIAIAARKKKARFWTSL